MWMSTVGVGAPGASIGFGVRRGVSASCGSSVPGFAATTLDDIVTTLQD